MAAGLKAAVLGAVLFAGGCATCTERTAEFSAADRFAFRNELHWRYEFGEDGSVTTHRSEPAPDYALHCFPMVRAAREFAYHARFEASLPRASEGEYRKLVRAVVRRDSRCPSAKKVAIPGYSNLAEFSREHEALLKQEIGNVAASYLQRGNWRMVFPFSRRHQQATAEKLKEKIARGLLPIVHLVDFPGLRLNHVILLARAEETEGGLKFEAYDPNNAERPATLRFNAEKRTFEFERNEYFAGGAVDVYEVYRNALF